MEINAQTTKAHITRVYPQVKDGRFTVDLSFEGADPPNLVPGRAGQGRLSLGGDAPAVVIPAGAFLERTGGDWIFVLDKSGDSAERRRIKVGRRNSEKVEIVGGLKPGERVITSDYTGYDRIDRIILSQ